MTNSAGTAAGQSLFIGGAVAAAALVVSLYGLGVLGDRKTDAVVDAPEPVVTTEETAVTEADPAPAADAPTEEETVADAPVETQADDPAPEPEAVEEPKAIVPDAPSFDIVRIEPNGSTLVAGKAASGGDVEITLDGVTLETVKPGADDKFAAFLDVPPSEQPRVMGLVLRIGDHVISSNEQIIIAPVAPQAVAEAETASDDTVADAEIGVESAQEAGDAIAEAAVAGAAVITETAEELEEVTPQPAADAVSADAGSNEPEAVEKPTVDATPESDAEPKAPVVLLATEDGVKLVQPAQSDSDPATRANVILDAITYGETGAVELAGRGEPQASVRVYLNNDLAAESTVDASGVWTASLTDIDAGLYTLRVDQLDGEGKVTSRVETPFKREAEEKIAAVQEAQAQAEAAQAEAERVQNAQSPATETQPADTQTSEVAPTGTQTTALTTNVDTATDPARSAEPTVPAVRAVTVQPGNTLWAIARDSYGDGVMYVRVFEANKDLIRDPDLIYPGQVFNLPE